MPISKELFEKQKQERLGEVNYNGHGSKMTIIRYNSIRDIRVQFDDGYETDSEYYCFKNSNIKNPYDRTAYGIGYLGEGKYQTKLNNKFTKEYEKWIDMLKRCYSNKFHEKNPTYKGCTVNEKWHNFQVFADWFRNNYYQIDNNEKMCLDKDILVKGNKEYGEDTSIIVPNTINVLFNKHKATRGEYPIGVYLDKKSNKFKAKYNNTTKTINLGSYDTPEEAFNVYKEYKENYIKQVANKYKDKIPEKLYNSMMEYQVEITD